MLMSLLAGMVAIGGSQQTEPTQLDKLGNMCHVYENGAINKLIMVGGGLTWRKVLSLGSR